MVETRWARLPEEAIAAAQRLDARLSAGQYQNGGRSFFAGKSLTELAREQGVCPIEDAGIFAGGFPADENLDEMLDEIYRLREP